MTTILNAALANAFPSAAFADTQVRPGEVAVVEGRDSDGHRHVLILAGLRPHSWTAFARARRQTNGQPYAAWKAATQDAIRAALAASGTAMYPRDATLGLAMSFGATLAKRGGEMRRTSVRTWDYTDLFKAFEDVLSGLLYADDDRVRHHGPGHAVDTTQDYICCHVWCCVLWDPAWSEFTVPDDEGGARGKHD